MATDREDPLERIRELQARLDEAEETLRALRSGEVDAVVASGPDGDQVYTLKGADEAYRVMVQTMMEGAVTLTRDGLILFSNEQFASMLGLPLERVIGSSIHDFVAAEDASMLSALLTGSAGRKAEVRLKAGPAALTPVQVSANALAFNGTECVCFIVTDLTEQKRNQEIVAAERLARSILEQVARPILVVDLAGKIVRASRSAEEMANGPVLLRQFDDVLSLRSESEAKDYTFGEILSTVQRQGRIAGLEAAARRPDGRTLDVLMSANLLAGANSECLGCIVGLSDVSRLKKAEEELRVKEDQLRQSQKMESIGVLAGGIAHDFNNLLTGVMGNASIALESMPAWDRNRPLLEAVITSANQAADLTRQLLAYAGKGRFIVRPLNVSEMLRGMMGLLRGSVPAIVGIDLDLQEDIAPVEADEGQIQQIVMNLVLNAAEAIGDRPGQILIQAQARSVDAAVIEQSRLDIPAGTYVCLEVQDTGPGMDEATKSRIFEPFFTTKFTGRGLGLAAVHGIVRAHKGAVLVYSHPGNGARFTVLLPAADSGPSQKAEITARVQDLYGQGTILVVDDEEAVRMVAKASLERFGYRVLLARNGIEAVEIFEQIPDQISVVLLDLTMPLMSGEETFRRLRAIRADAPVLLSSGYNQIEVIKRFAGQGLAGFVGKPYSASTLVAKVKSVCNASEE